MAPEQFDGSKRVDERTDIWALGIVLYELTTGTTPFESETIAQLISAVLHAQPQAFEFHGLVVPEGFEAIVERALSKSPADRFASVSELATALVPYGPMHASLRASRVSRLLPSVPRTSIPQPPAVSARPGSRTPVGSRSPSGSRTPTGNRSPSGDAVTQVDPDIKPASVPRAPTPSSWEMSEQPKRATWRKPLLVASALLLPVGGALAYRQSTTAPEPAVSVSANLPAAVAPAANAVDVAPQGPVAPEPPPHASSAVPPAPAPAAPPAAPADSQAPAAVTPPPHAVRPHAVLPGKPRTPVKPAETPPKPAEPAPARPAGDPPGVSDFGGRR
jgi:serine/threonine-protein kinase